MPGLAKGISCPNARNVGRELDYLIHRFDPVAHRHGRFLGQVQPTPYVGGVNGGGRAGGEGDQFFGPQPLGEIRLQQGLGAG